MVTWEMVLWHSRDFFVVVKCFVPPGILVVYICKSVVFWLLYTTANRREYLQGALWPGLAAPPGPAAMTADVSEEQHLEA